MLFHTSSNKGIRILEPNKSTHGRSYVYALSSKVASMIFGVNHSDFDFIIDESSEGIPRISECYPGGFDEIFINKSCSVYAIKESGFQKGLTGWEPEYVSSRSTRVLDEDVIHNLHARLVKESQDGNLIIRQYSYNKEYIDMIRDHITDRLVRFNIVNSNNIDPVIQQRYGSLIRELRSQSTNYKL